MSKVEQLRLEVRSAVVGAINARFQEERDLYLAQQKGYERLEAIFFQQWDLLVKDGRLLRKDIRFVFGK